ncbi:sulfotransferase family protein [Sphingobium bisphenolivorans]|uniref:sulfotransferase family protein n=1 Tax=Sphingobium bisphenolivorans TaxID=1335760 RepID=UPI0003A8D128|nr:sulfotransferase [Sphingobium bisphenolivorans]
MTDRKPRFIVIGAVKGATTWIAHQLRSHPQLWLPRGEPHFFSSEYERGAQWYASLFDPAPEGRMLGEKSADYLAHPHAAARMAAMLPDARLIVQLRDPVQRAYSDYCMLYRRGTVSGDPHKYLQGGEAGQSRFLSGGLYGAHLSRFLRYFAREQIQVILYESLRHSPEQVIAEVCTHIGVPVHIAPDKAASRRNDSKAPLLPLPLRRALQPVRPMLDPLRSNPLMAKLRDMMAAPVRYPPLTEELQQALRRFYRDDIVLLQDLLEKDLSHWLASPAAPAAPSPAAVQA